MDTKLYVFADGFDQVRFFIFARSEYQAHWYGLAAAIAHGRALELATVYLPPVPGTCLAVSGCDLTHELLVELYEPED